ncbi:MAG: hypothetical protein R6U93_07260 [Dehalococcoidia bacterium]
MSQKDAGRQSSRRRKPKAGETGMGSRKKKLLIGLGVVFPLS